MFLSFLLGVISGSQMRPTPPAEVKVFFVAWVILGVGSGLFFHFNRNAALKRKIWPVFIILIGVIFSIVAWRMNGERRDLLGILIPAVFLISFLNIRATRFCQSCGRTLYRQSVFTPAPFCQHCGAKIE